MTNAFYRSFSTLSVFTINALNKKPVEIEKYNTEAGNSHPFDLEDTSAFLLGDELLIVDWGALDTDKQDPDAFAQVLCFRIKE